MQTHARTNSPCRHSGIRPQHDPSIIFDGNDGCLRTEVKALNISACGPCGSCRFSALRTLTGHKSLKDGHKSHTYSGFHLLRQPLGPGSFQHADAKTPVTTTTTVSVCRGSEGDTSDKLKRSVEQSRF